MWSRPADVRKVWNWKVWGLWKKRSVLGVGFPFSLAGISLPLSSSTFFNAHGLVLVMTKGHRKKAIEKLNHHIKYILIICIYFLIICISFEFLFPLILRGLVDIYEREGVMNVKSRAGRHKRCQISIFGIECFFRFLYLFFFHLYPDPNQQSYFFNIHALNISFVKVKTDKGFWITSPQRTRCIQRIELKCVLFW